MHRCYVCNPSNPDHVLRFDEGPRTATVPVRFAGPPGTANGGIATGMLACPALASIDAAAFAVTRISARLRGAVPLQRPLDVEVVDEDSARRVSISEGENVLISGAVEVASFPSNPRPADQIRGIPPERLDDVKQLATVDVPDRPPFFEETGDHPIRGCFSCGPDNSAGMHIYPRVAADGVTCAPWHAAAEFDDGNGAISPMIVASALDCSSGICMPVSMQRELLEEDRFFLLGSLDVTFLRLPLAGSDYRIAAKALLRDGRKFFGMSAMFDARGTPYAIAEATWIVAGVTRTEAFGARA